MLQAALTLVEETSEIWVRPELHRRRACCALASAPALSECAEQWLSDAVQGARQQGNRITELRAGYDLARLWIGQGNDLEARDLLASIHTWLTGCSDLHDMAEARALLDTPPFAAW